MNDDTLVQRTHTKKHHIPLSHLERAYIQQCTDGSELQQIYEELIGGEEGSFQRLKQLTLDRIQNIQSNNQISVINWNSNRSILKTDHEWEKFEEKVSREFNSDFEDNKSDDEGDNESNVKNKRIHMGNQLRLNGDAAFKLNNYQQSVDLYTQSLSYNNNLNVHLSRALTNFKLNHFDASIEDCSQVLTMDSENIKALLQRSLCYRAKGEYDEARRDLNQVLLIEPDHNEAQNLLNTLSTNSDSLPTYNQTLSLNDDEDDMALGDEAAGGVPDNLSDEDTRSVNVSPNMHENYDTPELIRQKPLQTPPLTPSRRSNMKNDFMHQPIIENNTQNPSTNFSYDQIFNNSGRSNNSSSYKQNTNYRINDNDSYSQNTTVDEEISNSNFGSIIQCWLRDLVKSQPSHRYSSYYDRPWSKSHRPWSLENIQRDIEKFNRSNNYKNAIEVSKKMLQNGVLDYHYHAEYIFDTLFICAESYLESDDYLHAIQYATEALQYNKTDDNALICRAKAFEKEKFFLFSYADYSRVPKNNSNYHLAQYALNKLLIELNSNEDKNWRDKISSDETEHYLTYFKSKTDYSEENSYEWYQTYGDKLYIDNCFILAIQFYTHCIQAQPTVLYPYLKRSECYLKVYEPQKCLADCDVVLKEDPNNILALYCKASAYKLTNNDYSYELTLKECIKIQPNNPIILGEYYSSKHKQIPRKKRRIRMNLFDENILSYEELEQIRLKKIESELTLDLIYSNSIQNYCLFILHLSEINFFQSFHLTSMKKFIEIFIHFNQLIIQLEENYQKNNQIINLNFSYINYCFQILIQLTNIQQIELILSMIDDNYRLLLDQLIDYYSTSFDQLHVLKKLKKF